jgi:hypothetical protein
MFIRHLDNAGCNTRLLARLAGVPCPQMRGESGFSFSIWEKGDRWGHIDVVRHRVTEFDPALARHRVIFPVAE